MQLPNNTVPSESNFLAPFFGGAGKSSAAAEALTSVGVPAGEGKFEQLFDGLQGSPKQPGTPTPADMASLGFVACPMPFVPVAPAEELVVATASGIAETEVSVLEGECPAGSEFPLSVGNPASKAAGHGIRDSRMAARGAKTAAQLEKDAAVEGATPSEIPGAASESNRTVNQPNEQASEIAFQTPRFSGLPETALEHRKATTLPPGLTRLMAIHAPVTSTPEASPEATTEEGFSTETTGTASVPLLGQDKAFGSRPTIWPGASGQNHTTPFPTPTGSARRASDLDLSSEPVLSELPAESFDLSSVAVAREELLASDTLGRDLGQAMRSLNSSRGLETSASAEDLTAEADALLSSSPETVVVPSRNSEKRELPETSRMTAKIADALDRHASDADVESDKSFVGHDKERVATSRKHVGTDVAKQGADMFSRFLPTAAQQPSASDHAGSVVAASENVSESALHGETVPVESVSTAHEAVEVVLKTVEQASTQEQKSVNLRFSVGDVDLSVRVELHANQVRTTFRTDSPELRAALSQEWEAISSNASGERTLKHVPAFVTASENSSLNSFSGDTSSRQRDQRAERETNERAVRVTSKSRGPAAATPVASTHAGISGIAPLTSRRLHTVA